MSPLYTIWMLLFAFIAVPTIIYFAGCFISQAKDELRKTKQ